MNDDNFEVLVDNMVQSVFKNIGELCEVCVEKGIYNAYDLMEIVEDFGG